jgi:hypothetical protein
VQHQAPVNATQRLVPIDVKLFVQQFIGQGLAVSSR